LVHALEQRWESLPVFDDPEALWAHRQGNPERHQARILQVVDSLARPEAAYRLLLKVPRNVGPRALSQMTFEVLDVRINGLFDSPRSDQWLFRAGIQEGLESAERVH
jgi:hypothetical protein